MKNYCIVIEAGSQSLGPSAFYKQALKDYGYKRTGSGHYTNDTATDRVKLTPSASGRRVFPYVQSKSGAWRKGKQDVFFISHLKKANPEKSVPGQNPLHSLTLKAYGYQHDGAGKWEHPDGHKVFLTARQNGPSHWSYSNASGGSFSGVNNSSLLKHLKVTHNQ